MIHEAIQAVKEVNLKLAYLNVMERLEALMGELKAAATRNAGTELGIFYAGQWGVVARALRQIRADKPAYDEVVDGFCAWEAQAAQKEQEVIG